MQCGNACAERFLHGRVPTICALARTSGNPSEVGLMALTITSPAFPPNGAIPNKHTCEGDDVSPALEWSGVPDRARSLALIVDDPDAPDPAAPKMVYVHWVVYDIPTSAQGLPEGMSASRLPKGAREGKNDWKRLGYGGPCPPIGRHRYFFKLYALDTTLDSLTSGATKTELEAAMRGHVIERAELVGTYQGAHGPAKARR
jgi:Raf kinase inhibitor-like YbhB/YbcL family protein